MIQTTEVSITYKGDGVQTSFPYPYPYRNSDDIVGYIINDVGYEKRITNNFKYDKVSNIYQYPLAGAPWPRHIPSNSSGKHLSNRTQIFRENCHFHSLKKA